MRREGDPSLRLKSGSAQDASKENKFKLNHYLISPLPLQPFSGDITLHVRLFSVAPASESEETAGLSARLAQEGKAASVDLAILNASIFMRRSFMRRSLNRRGSHQDGLHPTNLASRHRFSNQIELSEGETWQPLTRK